MTLEEDIRAAIKEIEKVRGIPEPCKHLISPKGKQAVLDGGSTRCAWCGALIEASGV